MTKTILILLSILALHSALDVQLEKDFFYVGTNNTLHNILYQTQHYVIAQSIEVSGDQFIPQYLALDVQTGNATKILADVSSACDPAPYIFGKLIYHDASDKLVYYCTNNNTILFIDQESFEVFDTISTGAATIYNETRLASNDDFLVVLGINDFFGTEPTATQFIRVNLMTREVTSNFGFSGNNQTVVAFAANQLASYVLAVESQNMSETAYLYLLVWEKNIHKQVLLTSFNYPTNGSSIIHDLHCFGSYVVTNTATDMFVINQFGRVAQDYANLNSKRIYISQSEFAVELSYGMQYESSDLYVLFNDGTLKHLNVSSSVISSEVIGTAAQMMLVIGDQTQSNLLFTISDQGPLFNVINITTKEVIYSRPNDYNNLMLTNSTYTAELAPYLFIFDNTNNTLLANVTIAADYFHDTDNGFIYFLTSSSSTSCKAFGLDLTSAQSHEIYEFGSSEVCAGSIITQVDGSTPTSPHLAIALSNSSFFILTNDKGLLIFTPIQPTLGANFVYYSLVDFSTLNLQSISCEASKKFTIDLYTFDSTNNSFISNMNYSFMTDAPLTIYEFYTVGIAEVVGISDEFFGYLDIQTTKPGLYNINYTRSQLSLFHDTDNNTYVIFSEDPNYPQTISNQTPYLFTNSTLGQLPQTSSATTQAGAAGFCSYWMVDGMISSVGIVKFYNGCSNSVTETVSI